MNKKPVPDPGSYPVIPPDMDYLYFEGAQDFPPESENMDYSALNAWWFAEASFLAYCHPGFARMAYRLAGFDGFRFFQGKGTEVMAAWNDTMMIVSFRGTELKSKSVFHEVLTDLNTSLVSFEGGGAVHKGFLAGLDEVWEGEAGLCDFLNTGIRQFPDRPLWICGHSLGAALGALCFARIPEARGLYMYGAPRVGDREFQKHFTGRCVWRFEHAGDPVPLLPPDIPAFKFCFQDIGILKYIRRTGEVQSKRPDFHLKEQKTRILQTREVQNQRKKMIGRNLAKSPFNDDGAKEVLNKVSEYLKISMEEWKSTLDEFQEDFGLTVDHHQPIFYAVKLWNALVEDRLS